MADIPLGRQIALTQQIVLAGNGIDFRHFLDRLDRFLGDLVGLAEVAFHHHENRLHRGCTPSGSEALTARDLVRTGEEGGKMVAEADDAAVGIALALRLVAASRRQRQDFAVRIHGDRRQRFARWRLPLPLPRLARWPRPAWART